MSDKLLESLLPLGEEPREVGSHALRERLEMIRSNFHDLTRSGMGGGGLSLLPLLPRWKSKEPRR